MPRPSASFATISLAGVQCVGYLRVSTERQAAEDRASLRQQDAAIAAHASTLGATVGHWFRDEGASGASAEKRAGFQELLSACRASPRAANAPGHVLALNDSRWGRFPDPEEAAYWRTDLRRVGWLVRFAEGNDIRDATARGVVRFVGAAQSSEYRKQLVANVRRGLRGSADAGYWTREAPLGYRRHVVVPADRGRTFEPGERKTDDDRVKLTPHDGEAALVREMFTRYVERESSLGALVRGLAVRFPDRAWTRRTVQAVLQNPAYLGHVVGGRRKSLAARALGLPEGEEYGKHDVHPAIVTETLWNAAQARLATNPKRSTVRNPGRFALSRVVRCATCGRHCLGGGSGTFGRARRCHFYKCAGHTARVDPCPPPFGSIGRDILEGAIAGAVARTLKSPAVARRILAALDDALAPASTEAARATLKVERRAVEGKVKRLTDAIADGILSSDDARARMTALTVERDRLAAEETALRFVERRQTVTPAERDRLAAAEVDVPRQLRRLSGAALREVLLAWLHEATFDKVSRTLTLAINPVPSSLLGAPSLWRG